MNELSIKNRADPHRRLLRHTDQEGLGFLFLATRGAGRRDRWDVPISRGSACVPVERATDREVGVVAAVLEAGAEKAADHRFGLSHSTEKRHLANARSKVGAVTTAQFVRTLTSRLPDPDGMAPTDE